MLEKYLSRTLNSKRFWEESKKIIPSGVFRNWYFFQPYPFYVARASGSRIYDVDGNEYIDFNNNASALILGHSHPKILSAIEGVMQRGIISAIGPTELDYKYAEIIREANPCAKKLRVSPSGTEAVMYSTRIARAYTKKNKIAKFEGAYSGSSDFLAFGENPPAEAPLPPTATLDTEGVPEVVAKYAITLPWNNIPSTEKIIKENRKDLAAVIVDPCVRAMAPPQDDFLKAVREITAENDVLLVMDEVVSGFRLSHTGAYGYWGIVPDVVVYGKIIGGGFPIGAFASTEEIMSLTEPEKGKTRVPHSGTFSAHPFAIAAGYATLQELKKHPQIYDRINRYGDRIRKGLSEIFGEKRVPAVASGYASLFRTFFTDKKILRNYRDVVKSKKQLESLFRLELMSRGVFLALWSNVSAAITEKDVETMLKAAEESVDSMANLIKS
jgi:glutamate-1-semialdehyde 2,1-aminomutase